MVPSDVVRRLALLAVSLVLAGCAGSMPARRGRGSTGAAATCRPKAEARALVRLDRDLAALRAAGRVHVKNRLLGGPAVNRLTDRFLHDLELAPISNLKRNRLIDFAAEAVIANCRQCFQALEAERPIPSIAHEANGAAC